MNARLRRVTTSGMLILAALSFGCGSDHPSSLLPVVPGEVGAVPQQTSDFAPFGTTRSAQRVGAGTDGDVETANLAADGLLAILRGGALEAASPTGGAIADPSGGIQLAALSSSNDSAPVASDAQLPRVTGVASLRRLIASPDGSPIFPAGVVQTAPVFTFEGQTLTITSSNGARLTLTGVSPLPAQDLLPTQAPPAGFTLSADVRVTGALGGERPHPIDVRVRGLTGTLTFVPDKDPIVDLTTGDSGVTVSGSFENVSAVVVVTGASGRFTSAAELNALLAGRDLKVRITEVRVKDVVASAQATVTIENLQVPVTGDRPSGRVTGAADIIFDASLPFSHDGKIAHAALDVAPDKPLVFDGQTDGPRSGTIVATLHHASTGTSDTITITFQNGEASLDGVRTNLSGNPEQVVTQGHTTSATGSVVFTDGRRTDHRIEVRRRTGGRRHIIFRVTIKSREGLQVLNLVGAVKSDHSLSGTWARGQSALPVGALPVGARTQERVPERAGTFRVSAEGVLELSSETGDVLARGGMPADWNRGLRNR